MIDIAKITLMPPYTFLTQEKLLLLPAGPTFRRHRERGEPQSAMEISESASGIASWKRAIFTKELGEDWNHWEGERRKWSWEVNK